MSDFYGNPIKVIRKNEIVDFIDIEVDFNEDFYVLKISSEANVIFNNVLNEDTLITIDAEKHPEIKIEYINKKTNEVFKSKIFNFNSNVDNYTQKKESKNEFDLIDEIYKKVQSEMDNPVGNDYEVTNHTRMLNNVSADPIARKYVENKINNIVNYYSEYFTEKRMKDITYEIYSNLYGMGIIQELDDNESIGEILVNARIHPEFKCDVYYYQSGQKYKFDKTFSNINEVDSIFSRSIKFAGKELNQVENAIIEATRANGDRVTISIPNASPNNYSLNIRKFTNFTPNSAAMKESGTIDDEIESLLSVLVSGKANIGIGGEMGTGKTTLINYLLTHTEKIERKVVIASVNEIDVNRVLEGHDVIIYNVDDSKGFTFEKLIKTSLRTTAGRIIIPESRGEEFRQVYEANLKTRGNMFTAHALDDASFVDMCVDMYNLSGDIQNINIVRNKLSKSMDIVIIMKKIGASIRIQSISEVLTNKDGEYTGLSSLVEWIGDVEHPTDPTKGKYEKTGNKISENLKHKLNASGISMSTLDQY